MRFALLKSDFSRLAPLKSAPLKSAPVKLALFKLAFANLAFARDTPGAIKYAPEPEISKSAGNTVFIS